MEKYEVSNELNYLVELVDSLLESGIYISSKIDGRKFAALCGLSLKQLNSSLINLVGYTIDQLLSLYRLQYASFLMKRGLPYKRLYRYCGFRSEGELERAQKLIVN